MEGSDGRYLVRNGVRVQIDVGGAWPMLVLGKGQDAFVCVWGTGDQGPADQPGPIEPVLVGKVVGDPVGLSGPQLVEAALAPVFPPAVLVEPTASERPVRFSGAVAPVADPSG
jgi:hypothetical protein